MTALRLGTRASELATTQSQWVADLLHRACGRVVELVPITTEGDTSRAHLSEIGGTGVFAAALRQAVVSGEVDLAVHSLKDLPTAPYPGLTVAAVTVRQDPRDVLVARDGLTLGGLPAGSRVGTGSARRAAQLHALGLGLDVVPIRGNVDTRLRMVADGTVDAVVLARAGLLRLGRADEATEVIDPLQMLPAPGQGALAVEVRDGDEALIADLEPLDHEDTRASVTAERSLLAALEAGCTAPVGALGDVVESLGPDDDFILELSLRAMVAAPDGSVLLRQSMVGPADDPTGLGRRLAALLLEDGAADLVAAVTGPLPGSTPVVVPSAAQSRPESAP